MSPRRSSRARTTQPSPALLQHTNSNSSGNSLTRGERNTRSNNKHASPQRSSTQRSQSLDDSDGKPDLPQTRQRHRAQEDDDELSQANDDEGDEEENDEEEITRCLCGQQEYPGLPPSRRSATGRHRHQAGGKDNTILAKDEADSLSDDIGSMFIQCDSCKVWQHGGCVGIMDEAMSPDEYFCEECRKDLHKITAEPNGSHSSQYLPVAPVFSPESSSRESSSDNARRSRDSRSRQADPPKRRSTMNSRDAAYDEEELLRRAIEESKEDTRMSNDETSSRRTKRSRSDDEVNKQAIKRPRTSSPSPSAVSKLSVPPSQPVSEDESKPKTNGANRPKRGVSGRNQKDKETKEPEEQPEEEEEIEQPEPITRRKSRSEKKREDESDHETEASPTKPPAPAPAPSEPEPTEQTPGTPAPAAEPAPPPPPPRQSTRKSGRPPARRGGRLGRNQYTRDRDLNGDGVNSPNSPHGNHFRDNGRDSPIGGPNGVVNGADGKGKGRHLNPHRTSMNEMKRRVAAILDFISRMQVEMAASGENVTPPENNATNDSNGAASRASLIKGVQDQLGSLLASTNSEGASVASSAGSVADSDATKEKEKDFKDLTSIEMMDVLTRHLLKWQQEYGKYGEK
ncbi:Zinc finger, PHD-finger [Penicillium occitanis (nom. inval.)]|nr:Zinc finger, PHD-finger [Penicillium occitanis (nom. inval.)]PCG99362.1 hypothetical protein PENOC_058540 [Penicillium occitanis (nom. inval.)]